MCGSTCGSDCESVLAREPVACPAVCYNGCFCPRGLVAYRDRCVDPRECYVLLNSKINYFRVHYIYVSSLYTCRSSSCKPTAGGKRCLATHPNKYRVLL